MSSYARGVLIWLARDVPFVPTNSTTDQGGRYVILQGCLDGSPLTLAAIYAANSGHSTFFEMLSPGLFQDPNNPTIWGGDFNCVPDIVLDCSLPPIAGAACWGAIQSLQTWLSHARTLDVWRLLHPIKREYSFYSPVHHIYTRLDLFACSGALIPRVSSIDYLASTQSDHCPLQMRLARGRYRPTIPTWRLRTEALKDNQFRDSIDKHLSQYFVTNTGTTDTRATDYDEGSLH